MKVYVVVGGWYAEAGGWNYVGMDGETLRLFDCLSTAEAYRATLLEDGYTEVTPNVNKCEHGVGAPRLTL